MNKERPSINVIRAYKKHAAALASLSILLWPENDKMSMENEFADLLRKSDAAVFLAVVDEIPVAFAQCQLRHDYVEGTDSSPVGYLEGIYVIETERKKGIARSLLTACEEWAKEKGCSEFASDCELGNTLSLLFHQSIGFAEANRIICFTKKL